MEKEMLKIDNYKRLSNLGESYINYIDIATSSIDTYRKGIQSFLYYMQQNNIKNPIRKDVINYRNELRKCYSANTVNSYMTAIRGLFKYLEVNKAYVDITKQVKGSKSNSVPKKQVLTEEQAKNIYMSLTDLREKALFSLLISTGIRGIECVNAKIEDIKTYNNELVLFIKCKGHNDKDEYVKLSKTTSEDLFNYIRDRKNGYIFVSNANRNNGNGVTTKTIRLLIKNIFKRHGLDADTFSLHSCRRSFACIAYNNGASIYDIKTVLHHSSISTTSRYVQQADRDINKTELNVSNVVFGQ